MNKIELLAPAGSLEKAKIALLYGADAVFVGGLKFSLRARASNFTINDIKELTEFAHSLNKKVYITLNILPHNGDLEGLDEYLKALDEIKIDGAIVASLYIAKRIKEITNIELHISTQTSAINNSSLEFYASLGASRVVLGRELTKENIFQIVRNSPLEIETFIHGGMCTNYSGRCMLSNIMTNRDANRGGCAHSCRWSYDLKHKGVSLCNDSSLFWLGSKDLCALKEIPYLIDSGVKSLKIEGRMKSLYYIATIVKAYRMLIDEYYEKGFIESYLPYQKMIESAENRPTGSGFLEGIPKKDQTLYEDIPTLVSKDFVMIVLDQDEFGKTKVEQRNYFEGNSTFVAFGPKMLPTKFSIKEIYDVDGNILDAARHPEQIIIFYTDLVLHKNDFVRLEK